MKHQEDKRRTAGVDIKAGARRPDPLGTRVIGVDRVAVTPTTRVYADGMLSLGSITVDMHDPDQG